MASKLSASFILETLIHSKEKVGGENIISVQQIDDSLLNSVPKLCFPFCCNCCCCCFCVFVRFHLGGLSCPGPNLRWCFFLWGPFLGPRKIWLYGRLQCPRNARFCKFYSGPQKWALLLQHVCAQLHTCLRARWIICVLWDLTWGDIFVPWNKHARTFFLVRTFIASSGNLHFFLARAFFQVLRKCMCLLVSPRNSIKTCMHVSVCIQPTMLQWIEIATKLFNTDSRCCEWFMNTMAEDDWWPQQILIKCPNHTVRQVTILIVNLMKIND